MEIKTRKQYVERLRSMLNNSKEPCGCCPCQKRFRTHTDVFPLAESIIEQTNMGSVCALCKDFVDLALNNCPCVALKDSKKAIQNAHAAIERWDNGTHKWQIQTVRIDEDDVTFPKAVKVK